MPANGERVGNFVFIQDSSSGVRYAVRPYSVAIISDVDETHDATLLHITGGRTIRVEETLGTVITWFTPPARS